MRIPFWRGRKRHQELDEEIRLHFQMAVKDRIERGESQDEAELATRREFGNTTLIKEVTREMWGWASIDRLYQDLRFGSRMLAKNPGFTVVAVLTLALGIGANTAMFSVLNVYLFRGLPYPDSDRLVQVLRVTRDSQVWPQHSAADLSDERSGNKVFEGLAAYDFSKPALVEQGRPAQTLNGLDVSSDFFTVLGVQPQFGRVFTMDEDQPGRDTVIVLSDRFWISRFGGDPAILGRKLSLDGVTVTVVGVMPAAFEHPELWNNVDIWKPLALTPEQRQDRGTHFLDAIARLKKGVSLQQAQESLIGLAAAIRQANPSKAEDSLRLELLQQTMSNDSWRKTIWFAFGLAAFVLLIACANLANLLLVRSAARAREHAVRSALGAGRLRLLRQSITESLLISLLGGVASILVAIGGIRFISVRLFSNRLGAAVPLDLRVLVFALLCSTVTGLLFGAVPAWLTSRADVNRVLKDNIKGASGNSHQRLQRALIVGEIAFALALLTGSSLFLRGIQRLTHRDPGWKVDGLLSAQLILQGQRYAKAAQRENLCSQLEERLRAIPGVDKVALSQSPAIFGFYSIRDIVIEGQPVPALGQFIAFVEPISNQYFATLGTRLIAGRAFTSADSSAGPQVIIINESLARRFWPNENAVGKRIGDPGGERNWREIVGVVNDIEFPGRLGDPETRFQIFRPISQYTPEIVSIFLRTQTPPETLANTLRTTVAGIDPAQPVTNINSARDMVSRGWGEHSLLATLLGAFAVLGLILAAIGIYGVISYWVTQRMAELGIRMALGAQGQDVVWLVLGSGARLVLAGSILGAGASYAVSRLLTWSIPSIPSHDPVLMGIALAVLVAVSLLTCFLPAWGASRIDPMEALRRG